MVRILLSLGSIVFVAALVATGTTAFFGDTESATGNTFSAGAIDLKIDNESYYNSAPNPGTSWELKDLGDGDFFFNFLDLKPDDEGEDTISLHVEDNDAWACMDITVTANDENGCNEPEGEEDSTCGSPGLNEGELADAINFVWWADDGDNVLETHEEESVFYQGGLGDMTQSLVLADVSGTGILSDGPLLGSEDYYIGKAWCFGTLTLSPVAGDAGIDPTVASGVVCNGTDLGNETQTDSVMADISFRAVQARHNTAFLCSEEPPCTSEARFADEVVSEDQGLRKNGTSVNADRSVPAYALGMPQSTGAPYDNPVISNSFFSLGFPLEGHSAEILLSFDDNIVVNGTGPDLKLWEVTGGSNYPDEKVDVYVRATSLDPWTLVATGAVRDAEIDIAPLTEARYVRIVDASDAGLFENTADGYDLDAVEALNCAPRFTEEV